MRTVKTKLSKKELEVVHQVASKSKLSKSVDIVEDIFGFMKDPDYMEEGEIVEGLIDDYAKGKVEWYLATKKKIRGRIEFFKRLFSHPYYNKFRQLDAEESSSILLEMLNAFVKAKKENPDDGGMPSPQRDEAMQEFESLIKYGKELFDLLDDDFFNSMMQNNPSMGDNAPDEDDTPEETKDKVKAMIAAMARELKIYDLSKKLEFTIRTSPKGKWNEVLYPDNGMDVCRMKGIRDITRLLPSQFAMDDDLFLKKLLNKELLKKKYTQRQEKRQILYMIVDNSGSMDDKASNTFRKFEICKAVAIALMKKLIDNEDLFYFRWFSGQPQSLHKIKTKKDAIAFVPYIMYNRDGDGDTNIMYALETACQDIKSKKVDKADMMDILLITDGYAQVDVEQTNKCLGDKIDLHSVIISTCGDSNSAFTELKQVSKNFLVTSAGKDSDVISITNLFTK
ncbi:MAG: VWA domain-containing protein [Gallionella sp.]